MQGSRNHGAREHRPPNILTGGPCPCNVEAWQLLIKLANDELTHNKEMHLQFCLSNMTFAPPDVS